MQRLPTDAVFYSTRNETGLHPVASHEQFPTAKPDLAIDR